MANGKPIKIVIVDEPESDQNFIDKQVSDFMAYKNKQIQLK